MAVLGWIVFGLIVGIVAKFLTPGRDPGGFIVTILLGIAGALLGGFLGRAAGWYHEGDPVGDRREDRSRVRLASPREAGCVSTSDVP